MSETTIPSHDPTTCAACIAIDRFDGVEDGKVFGLDHWSVTSEHSAWQSVRQAQDQVADRVTGFAGSLTFVYLHGGWFLLWVLVNVGIFGFTRQFDPYPFGLLTMIVSLEAIFLSTFVMVSQNRQSARSDVRSQVDFESNLRSLIWLVHVAHKLDVDVAHVEGLCNAAVEESRRALPRASTNPTG